MKQHNEVKDMAKELTITVKILLEAEEEELFEATDEDSLIGQAD